MSMTPSDLLLDALSRVVAPVALDWLRGEIGRQREAADERKLGIALGLAGRKIGRTQLALTDDERASAGKLSAGWQPELQRSRQGALSPISCPARCRAHSRPPRWSGSTPRSRGSAMRPTSGGLRSRSALRAARSDACRSR